MLTALVMVLLGAFGIPLLTRKLMHLGDSIDN